MACTGHPLKIVLPVVHSFRPLARSKCNMPLAVFNGTRFLFSTASTAALQQHEIHNIGALGS